MDPHSSKKEISLHVESNPEIRTTSILCPICKEHQTKYTCPKCQMMYCSLSCYQKHNNQCTEYFYKENVVEYLKSTKATDEEKQKMARILKQMFEEEKDTLSPELTSQMMDLDLDDPNLFEKLPRDQQEDFKRALSDGRLSNLIELWQPWWKQKQRRIQEIKMQTENLSQSVETNEKRKQEGRGGGEEDEEKEDENGNDDKSKITSMKSSIPLIISPIPRVSSLTKTQPSPLLLNNIVEVLYGYVYIMRFYNGDCHEMAIESLESLFQLSNVLNESTVYNDIPTALQKAIENSLKPTLRNSILFSISLLEDLIDIFQSKSHLLSALSDVYYLFDFAMQEMKKEKKDKINRTLLKKLEQSKKKIYFLIAFVNELPLNVIDSVRITIDIVWKQLQQQHTPKK